jgi:hypothetical protein
MTAQRGRPKHNEPAPQPEQTPIEKFDQTKFDFTEEELIAGLNDPLWRLNNLYKIVDKSKRVVTFRMNAAQRKLFNNLHTRNLILKARKMGFSTAIQICMLDTCLFSPNERGVVIAQDRETAEAIFRDVFRFAYDHLPGPLKAAFPTDGIPSKTSITFINPNGNSVVEVRTSARGGTPSYLHISEFGKIAAKDPGKAREIITGSVTAVAENGMVFIESTAEGQEGEFYKLVKAGMEVAESGRPLWALDIKFFFFGWWEDPSYRSPANSVVIPEIDEERFQELEEAIGRKLDPEQKAWYVKFRDVTYSGDQEMMWQEMPGTPDEAFKVSMEGAIFKEQFKVIRKEQRIGFVPHDPQFPVSTFWDIGASDETAIWFVQAKRTHFAVINFIEESGEPFAYFVEEMEQLGYIWEYHFLPHDSKHRRQGAERNQTPAEMLQEIAPRYQIWQVPRTPDKQIAILQGRNILSQCVFDEKHCSQGLKHLQMYRKVWNPMTGTWRALPRHGPESNGSDAFLQLGQAKALGFYSTAGGGGAASGFGDPYGAGQYEEPDLGY